jgi:hypothetical protein
MTGHPTAAAITRDGKVVEVFRAQFISVNILRKAHQVRRLQSYVPAALRPQPLRKER